MRLPVLQNFQAQCRDDMRRSLKDDVSVQDLESSFCVHCRSEQCSEAKWADSKWDARILTQEDRLLDNPNFSDLTSGHHQELHVLDFPSLFKKAMRLEIADQRGDWELVTEPEEAYASADGKPEVSEAGTDAFEAAMKAFKGIQTTSPPRLGGGLESPLGGAVDRKAPPPRVKAAAPVPDTHPEPELVASSPFAEPAAPDTAPGASEGASGPQRYVDLLMALPAVLRAEVKDDALRAYCKQGSNLQALPQVLGGYPVHYHVPTPHVGHNTHIPAGGIMVDGSAPPAAPQALAAPDHDPWAIPKEKRVQPGAVIKMGKA